MGTRQVVTTLHYSAIGHSPSQWFASSEILWRAALLMQDAVETARADQLAIFDRMDAAGDQDLRAAFDEVHAQINFKMSVWPVAAMLRAMAIEAELKGAYYAFELLQGKHAKDVSTISHHRLGEISRLSCLTLDATQGDLLRGMELMLQMGRFPLGWVRTQNVKKPVSNFSTDAASESDLYAKVRSHARDLSEQLSQKTTVQAGAAPL